MSGSERKPGRLGRYVVGYRDGLLELGYTPLSVSSYSLVAVGQLGRWMASEDVDVAQLDSRTIKAFLATRRTKDYRPAATASLVPLLEYLRDEGVTPPEPARALTPLDGLIGEYRDWLIVDRALAPETVRHPPAVRPALPGGADDTGGRPRGQEPDQRGRHRVSVARVRAPEAQFGRVLRQRAALAVALPARARLHGSRAGGLRAVCGELARRRHPQGVPPRRHRAAASVV